MSEKQYRLLNVGEVIQAGDEWSLGGDWVTVSASIRDKVSEGPRGFYRRPIKPDASTADLRRQLDEANATIAVARNERDAARELRRRHEEFQKSYAAEASRLRKELDECRAMLVAARADRDVMRRQRDEARAELDRRPKLESAASAVARVLATGQTEVVGFTGDVVHIMRDDTLREMSSLKAVADAAAHDRPQKFTTESGLELIVASAVQFDEMKAMREKLQKAHDQVGNLQLQLNAARDSEKSLLESNEKLSAEVGRLRKENEMFRSANWVTITDEPNSSSDLDAYAAAHQPSESSPRERIIATIACGLIASGSEFDAKAVVSMADELIKEMSK